MIDSYRIPFRMITDGRGDLVALEENGEIPFSIARVYYIYNVGEGVERGFHAHIDLHQVLICVHGSVKIRLRTPFETQEIILDKPTEGLFIGDMLWREMVEFTGDAVLMVLASKHYNEADYIRDYGEYEKVARPYYLKEMEK